MTDMINVLDRGYVRLVDHMGTDLSSVNAARASFARDSSFLSYCMAHDCPATACLSQNENHTIVNILKQEDRRLLAFLLRKQHTSPFRHAFLSFEIKAPLMIARQWWKYVVGSDHCQPSGTLVDKVIGISDVDGRTVITIPTKIEDIKSGDSVVSFNMRHPHIQRRGSKVTNVSKRFVDETITTVTVAGNTSRYTREHPCVVKIGTSLDSGYIVYLMRKRDSFRIGCTAARRNNSLGIRVRFTREQPDALWILGKYATLDEALHQEQVLAYTYGIPMTIFRATEKGKDQTKLDRFWQAMGNLVPEATTILKVFGLDVNEPLFTNENFTKSLKVQTTFITAAANLLDGMIMCVPDLTSLGHERHLWKPISVQKQHYRGDVYSLTVEGNHTYIADGIVTHNCMDGWNETSYRYVQEPMGFYEPSEWRSAPENRKQGSGGPIQNPDVIEQLNHLLQNVHLLGLKAFDYAIENGVAMEQARIFLPAYGMYTSWYWSASLQSVVHFLQQRLGEGAQSEITSYARAVKSLTQPLFPATLSVMEELGQL